MSVEQSTVFVESYDIIIMWDDNFKYLSVSGVILDEIGGFLARNALNVRDLVTEFNAIKFIGMLKQFGSGN